MNSIPAEGLVIERFMTKAINVEAAAKKNLFRRRKFLIFENRTEPIELNFYLVFSIGQAQINNPTITLL
jgi:hypothetical protein